MSPSPPPLTDAIILIFSFTQFRLTIRMKALSRKSSVGRKKVREREKKKEYGIKIVDDEI